MFANPFNPREAARDLEAAGIERKQAEAITKAMTTSLDALRVEFQRASMIQGTILAAVIILADVL